MLCQATPAFWALVARVHWKRVVWRVCVCAECEPAGAADEPAQGGRVARVRGRGAHV